MRQAVFILSLIAFLAASWADMAHAAADGYECLHLTEANITTDSDSDDCLPDQTPSKADIENCHDCCCLHVHVLHSPLSGVQTPHLNGKRMGLVPNTVPPSAFLYSVYKPPRS